MPKTKISEFSATPGNNTDIDGINIAEGCAPSGINDAIRELMAQLKDFQAGTAGDSFNGPVGTSTAAAGAFTTLSSTGNTTLGDASGDAVTINGATTFVNVSPTITPGTANGVAYLNGSKVLTTGSALTFDGTNFVLGSNKFIVKNATGDSQGLQIYQAASDVSSIFNYYNGALAFGVNNTEQMRLTSTGLGIGTSSPFSKLDVKFATDKHAILTASASYSNSADLIAVNDAGSEIALGLGGSTVRFYTGATERMRLDSSGNLGLGVTPSAWRSGAISYDVARSSYADENGTLTIASNAYRATSNWLYKVSTFATRMDSDSGQFRWYTAASGTAGNSISFTQAMTLDASGNLGVGTTSPTAGFRLDVQATTARQRIESTTGTNEVHQRYINTGGTFFVGLDASTGGGFGAAYGAALWHTGNYPMLFGTNNTERARITSGGDLLVGTTAAIASERFNVTGSVATNFVMRLSNSTATSPQGMTIFYSGASPNSSSAPFLYCYDTTTLRAEIRSNGGLANYSANDVNLSDRREKTNFAPAKSYLDTICAIPVQTFNYIDQSEDDPGLTLGVVAQDVQAVAPELVMESNWGTEDNPKMRLSIYQTDLQYALMKALQELKAEFDAYKATHP